MTRPTKSIGSGVYSSEVGGVGVGVAVGVPVGVGVATVEDATGASLWRKKTEKKRKEMSK